MTVPGTVADLLELYERLGDAHYGEDVSQLDHALQTAELAVAAQAEDELVAAALLHDVGHLIGSPDAVGTLASRVDDRHEAIGARVLAPILGASVAGPVALHVTAKRWRCAVEPDYAASLSAASTASLRAQGGPLDASAQRRFASSRSFDAALRLRSWDDLAKDPTATPTPLASYEPLLVRLAAAHRVA